MARFMKASEAENEAYVKALITGQSGSGKSTCGAQAPRPLVIEPAAQAVTSIRAANPDAFVFLVESMQDVRDVLYSLRQGKATTIDGEPALEVILTQDPSGIQKGQSPQQYGTIQIQSVVVDDLEEIQELARREIQGENPTMTQQQWGILLDKNMAMLRAFRSVRCNVFVCAKVLRAQDNESQVWELALFGSKFKPLLPGLFNAVCFMYRKTPTDTDPREFVAGFKLPEQYLTKCHPALDAVEDPNPTVWWEKIRTWQNQLSEVQVPTDPSVLPSDYKAPTTMPRRGRPAPSTPAVQTQRPPQQPVRLTQSTRSQQDETKQTEPKNESENTENPNTENQQEQTQQQEQQSSRGRSRRSLNGTEQTQDGQ